MISSRCHLASFCWLFGVGIFFISHLHAQDEVGRIRFTSLSQSTPGGLKSNLVRDITQDLGGYVWMATDRGLCRFDGWETLYYPHDPNSPIGLSSDQITSVASMRQKVGAIWIGTLSDGLMKLDIESAAVVRFMKGNQAGADLCSNHITSLGIASDRYLWIGTDAGLNLLNLDLGTIVVADGPLATASITSINTDEKGNTWIGTEDGGLYQWQESDQKFTLLWSTSSPIKSVVKDLKGRLWIGTSGIGLYVMADGESSAPKKMDFEAQQINSLFVDSNGDLWVGSLQGLALRDEANEKFIVFRHSPRLADSLVDNHVTTIFEDRSRMLWVATEDGGTSRFNLDRQWFPHIRYDLDRPHGLPHPMVTAFSSDLKDHILVGTPKGLALWDSEAQAFLKLPFDHESLRGTFITDILVDQQGVQWFATGGNGLISLSPDGTVTQERHDPKNPSSLTHDNISTLFENENGLLFVGTKGGGLLQRTGDGQYIRIPAPMGSRIDFINALAGDMNGNLWVSTPRGAFLLMKGGTSLVDYREAYPHSSALASENISCVLPHTEDIVWIGTKDAGLDKLNITSGEVTHFTSAVYGLPDDEITSLVRDRDNLLWVGTRNGVARLNAMHNEFRIFSGDDGLQKSAFSQGAVTVDHEGCLYYGGMEGFNIINPQKLPAMPRLPTPILTSFEYFGEPVFPRKGGILEKKIAATDEIRLPFDRRMRFGFRFANLDYRFPNRGLFRYRLEGFDRSWINPSGDHKASYNGISAGNYRFVVQSSLDGRSWSEMSANVRLVVLPPWWQTWWAISLGIALVIGVAVSSTRLSIRRRVLQLKYREEKRIAQRDRTEAALSRELQNGILLRRAQDREQQEEHNKNILSGALTQLLEEFSASKCFVFQITTEQGHNEDDSTALKNQLVQIGYSGPTDVVDQIPSKLSIFPFAKTVLESKHPVSFTNSEEIPSFLRDEEEPNAALSLLAVRTTFLDKANGIIFVSRKGNAPAWEDEENLLLQAIAVQFGITIAQIETAITEGKYRIHLEDARHQAEVANRAKSDFLAKMTHELRTPLSSIIGFTDMIAQHEKLSPGQQELIDIIRNSETHLLDVINEILDLSKIEAGRMERNDEVFEFQPMLASIQEMLSIKAKQNHIGFAIQALTPLPALLYADKAKLRQVLINIAGNGIKFTAQGAVTISINVETLSEPEEYEGKQRRSIRLKFEVRDTGKGIRKDELDTLFDRYTQTESGRRSSEGTGLGLPIARSFIQLMGGDIKPYSEPGMGTIFRFYIDCYEVARTPVEDSQEDQELTDELVKNISGFTGHEGEVRILIVEDHSANRLLLKRILGRIGFSLEEAINGEVAVDKWKNWKPHLILMDEEMPIMKGTEATKEIRSLALPGDQPIIVSLTANAFKKNSLITTENLYSDFVMKPFRAPMLLTVVAKHLNITYTFHNAA